MAKKHNRAQRRKVAQLKSPAAVTVGPTCDASMGVPPDDLVPVFIDLWRIEQRAKKEQASDRVLTACERASARVARLGFRVEDLVGEAYDPDMVVSVIENEGGPLNRKIVECIAPAVYYQNQLIQVGQVITRGDEGNGKDS